MRIQLSKLIGPQCITIDQAEILYDQILPALKAGEEVFIDLAGTRSLVALFLNHAVGVLFKDFERATLDSLLHFENAVDVQKKTITLVMKNSEKYHRDPEFRKAVDTVISRQFDEDYDEGFSASTG